MDTKPLRTNIIFIENLNMHLRASRGTYVAAVARTWHACHVCHVRGATAYVAWRHATRGTRGTQVGAT